MTSNALVVGILVVSDTVSQDHSLDRCGSMLRRVLEEQGRWKVKEVQYVPDEVEAIQSQVRKWSEEEVQLVLTSGGTGFTPRDRTPEAIAGLIERPASGLVHGMISTSLSITPFAMMARPVAGVIMQTLVITLPGSPKGAEENLLAIIKVLPHACEQICGADSRKLHQNGTAALEQEAGIGPSIGKQDQSHHHHHHHHGHHHHQSHHATPVGFTNDLSEPVTRRQRASPFPMISVTEALEMISANTPAPEAITVRVGEESIGHILAADVTASESVPAYRASIVDGYAVLFSDGPGSYPVTTVSHAALEDSQSSIRKGQIARVTTGAPIPDGADAIVMVEDTKIKSMTPDGREELEIDILAEGVKAGDNVREIGSDVRKGDVILSKGQQISAVGGEIGLLCSVGRAKIEVYRKPIVGILSTGNEVIAHDSNIPLAKGQIRDSNRPTLLSTVASWGYSVRDLGIAQDIASDLQQTLQKALEDVDVIITTGGVSMGELDLLKPTIERRLGGTIHFGRVAMKPGKPTTFASVEFRGKRKLIFALPGNPVSASVTFHLFVLPSLRQSSGYTPSSLPVIQTVLAQSVTLDHRPEYHRVIVRAGKDGRLQAESTGGQRSSRIGSLKSSNGLLCLPARTESLTKMEARESVDTILIGSLV